MNEHIEELKENPYSTASVMSRIFFWWTNPLIKEAHDGKLKDGVKYDTPTTLKAKNLSITIEKAWKKETEKSKEQPKLRRALLKVFGRGLVFCIIFHSMQAIVLVLLNAIVLGLLIDSFHKPDVTDGWRYGYAGIITLSTAIGVLSLHHELWCGQLQGMQMRISCCSLLYQKILTLPKAAMSNSVTAAKLLNMVSSDMAKLEQASAYIASPFIEPVSLVAHLAVLTWLFGVSIIPGFGALVLLTIYFLYQGKLSKMLRRKIVPLTDERLKATLGMLSDIRPIKMFTWEASFANVIQQRRRKQLKYLRGSALLRSISITNFVLSNKLALLPILITHHFLGGVLSAKMVFVTNAILASLKTRLTSHMSKTIPNVLECLVTLKRLEQILALDEQILVQEQMPKNEKQIMPHVGMWLRNMSASWDKAGKGFELCKINLSFDKCNLLIVTGKVGSGKTSLLMAILREMFVRKGYMESVGTLSYIPQDPWLFPSSIRQNIIFGNAYEEKRYKDVLSLCALLTDIDRFPEGDKTPVGDKGVSLSGGQKARINLARAMYQDGDIFLMDDPVSALDSRVGFHIFENCIYGANENKLRVLVTHHLHYIKSDKPFELITMNEGDIVKHKTYNLIENSQISDDDNNMMLDFNKELKNLTNKTEVRQHEDNMDVSLETHQQCVEEEDNEDCSKNHTNSLLRYIKQLFSIPSLIFFIILQLFAQIVSSAGDIWLSVWARGEDKLVQEFLHHHHLHHFNTTDNSTLNESPIYNIDVLGWHIHSSTHALLIYVVAFLLTASLSLLGSLLFYFKNISTAERLHDKMLLKVCQAKLYFFDTNPVGRIMNRFSKDMETLDDLLPTSFFESMTRLIGAVGMLATVIYSSTLSTIAVVLMTIVCIVICKIFFKASDDLKRLEPTAMSAVFVHLTSTVRGLICVRAHQKSGIVQQEFHGHQDVHTSVCFFIASFARWLGLYFEMILTLLSFMVSAIMIKFRNSATADYIGLAITSIFSVSNGIQFGVRQAVEAEINLSSIDRILEYVNLESEEGYDDKGCNLSKEILMQWPRTGEIIFNNASLYYEKNNRQVLKSLNFTIRSGEKIGIVGRTGAGKSSITAALFRMARIEGDILIDGVNINKLPLLFLRKRMSIIPQDPVMLIGSIRYNLDPFNEHTDDNVWKSLEDVHLKKFILELDERLHTQVIEGAANFSVGQRQLLCLARAILQNNKIIILDEATANVDRKSDEVVQELVKNVCQKCTILTIAHRLETVMNMDRIMVLDNGEIIEFDTPHQLLQNDRSMLSKLIQQMGENGRKELRAKAYAQHQIRNSLNLF